MIVATAGHVDHGKSTLVRLLTGSDPDRWAEEKRRGLTIDLGFAWMPYEVDGEPRTIGFVDVPGHRRFLPNMLAGCGAVDLALLVLSAREGWKPQTEEHTQILHLLGVDRGVVAITHRDAVDDADARAVTDQTVEHLRGTTLEAATIVTTSASDPASIETLREAITNVARQAPAATEMDRGRPRLWIDRSFTLKGTGRVVTGTLAGGGLAVDDEVLLVDGGREVSAHVRGVHVYGDAVERAAPGCRVGLALSRLESDPERGQAVVAPGQWSGGRRWQVDLWPVRSQRDRLEPRGGYQVFVGTAHTTAQLRYGGGDREATSVPVLARLHLSEAIAPVGIGDRFILRDESTDSTVGGGVVLAVDRRPARYRSSDLEARRRALTAAGVATDLAVTLVEQHGGTMTLDSLARQVGPVPIDGDGPLCLVDDQAVHTGLAARREKDLLDDIGRTGRVAEPADPLGRVVADELVDDGRLERHTAMLQPPGTSDTEYDAAVRAFVEVLAAADPPLMAPDELREATGQAMRHQSAAVRAGALIDVGPFLATPQRFDQLVDGVRDTLAAGPAPVGAFRDRLGLSRKYLIPLLETLDGQGLTVRDGDLRSWRGDA